MLVRISLIIAIIAGLAVGGLNFTKIKEKVTQLQTDLKTQTARADTAERDLASTRKDLDKTTAELKTTQATLATTTQERDTAQQEASAATKKSEQLTAELGKTTQERNDAQAELARYTATGVKPEEIIAFDKRIKGLQGEVAGLQGENRLLGTKLKKTENELERYTDPEKPVLMPASIRGKIIVTDPKYHFVVINVGEEQGVLR